MRAFSKRPVVAVVLSAIAALSMVCAGVALSRLEANNLAAREKDLDVPDASAFGLGEEARLVSPDERAGWNGSLLVTVAGAELYESVPAALEEASLDERDLFSTSAAEYFERVLLVRMSIRNESASSIDEALAERQWINAGIFRLEAVGSSAPLNNDVDRMLAVSPIPEDDDPESFPSALGKVFLPVGSSQDIVILYGLGSGETYEALALRVGLQAPKSYYFSFDLSGGNHVPETR